MQPEEAIRRYFDAINSDDFERLREVFADSITIQMGAASARHGIDEAIAYYHRALAPLPIHDDEAVGVLIADDRRSASVEIEFRGQATGGRRVDFAAVDLFDFDETGRITRLRSFYDTARVAALLTLTDTG
jgi:ketosteroid isomerase-like protein